jgi:hypothetical protein
MTEVRSNMKKLLLGIVLTSMSVLAFGSSSTGAHVERHYDVTPDAPKSQSVAAAKEKSAGCESCHTATDSASMHASPGVILGCTDCHGGRAEIFFQAGDDEAHVMEEAHVLPTYPDSWHYPKSANPENSYTLFNRESKEFVRFFNQSDLRVADEA